MIPHTEAGKGEQVRRTVFVNRAAAKLTAEKLQRRGQTLSEIAEAMDCSRASIVHLLYWEAVRS